MTRSAARRGPLGEAAAAAYLRGLGYVVLERNVRTRRGEVDLVVSRGDDLVFVEVKSWRSLPSAGLEHSINRRKQLRIAGVARTYVARNYPRYAAMHQRFDIILVRDGGVALHLPGAFEL
jgi:putative endonuclease